MAYTRLGNYLLARELSADPLGRIHRGFTVSGTAIDQNYLIRVFSEELQAAGVRQHCEDMEWTVGTLGGTRGLGTGYKVQAEAPVSLAWDYLPGRTLAQVIDKTRQEQVPLGIDHALSVIQGVTQALLQMHSRSVFHGCLSPCSIWVSFEGATQIVDGPSAAAITASLDHCPGLAAALRPYRPGRAATPFQADLYALGAMFYELLTLEACPAQAEIPAALSRATLKAAQDEAPIPAEIQDFLMRLTVERPFESPEELTAALERVLYDGDYSPTTFNMAFFMHTLFREENEQDQASLKEDRAQDLTPYLPSSGSAPVAAPLAAAPTKTRTMWTLGGVAVLIILGLLGFNAYQTSRKNAELEKQIIALRENSEKTAEVDQKQRQQKALEEELQRKLQQEGEAEKRQKLEKQLEESRQKSLELAKAKEEALKERERLKRLQDQRAAKNPVKPVDNTAPAATPDAPKPSVETAVQMTRPASARYPEAAIRSNAASVDRAVTLKVFVDSLGRPQKTIVVSGVPGNYGFDEAAVAAAEASGYQAATRDGKAVPGWITKSYAFPAHARESVSSDCQMLTTAPVRLTQAARRHLDQDRTVTVKIYVDSTGRAQKVLVASGVPGTGIDEAVRDSALASTYKPAERDGQKVAGWMTKTYLLPKQ